MGFSFTLNINLLFKLLTIRFLGELICLKKNKKKRLNFSDLALLIKKTYFFTKYTEGSSMELIAFLFEVILLTIGLYSYLLLTGRIKLSGSAAQNFAVFKQNVGSSLTTLSLVLAIFQAFHSFYMCFNSLKNDRIY
jgi:hypothetical protein